MPDFWPWIQNKKGVELGQKLHREKTVLLIIETISYLKKIKKDNNKSEEYQQLLLYFSGFIAHYALDLKVHPLIFEYGGTDNSHKKLEMEIDLKFSEQKWNLDLKKLYPVNFFDFGDKMLDSIADFYIYILDKVFSYDKNNQQINQSYQDYKKFYRLFYSPQGIKAKFISLIDKIAPMEISLYSYNLNTDFKILNSQIYNLFEEKYKQGIKEGLRLYKIIFAFLNNNISKKQLKTEIKNKNLLGRELKFS